MDRQTRTVEMYPPPHPALQQFQATLAQARAHLRETVRACNPEDLAAPQMADLERAGARLQALRIVAPLFGIDPGPG